MNPTNSRSKFIEIYLLLAIDALSIVLSYFLAYYLRFQEITIFENDAHKIVLLCLVTSCILYSLIMEWNKDYLVRGYYVETMAITKYNITLIIVAGLLIFLFKQAEFYSRLVFAYFAVCNQILTLFLHVSLKRFLIKYQKSLSPSIALLIVTDLSSYKDIIAALSTNQYSGYIPSGLCIWDYNGEEIDAGDIPFLGNSQSLLNELSQITVDEVFIHLPGKSGSTIRALILNLESMGAICHYDLDIMDSKERIGTLTQFGSYNVISYAIARPDPRRLLVKRIFDILGALIGLIITGILTPFIALAIKLNSKGPVFFTQLRVGKNGRRFKIYKFRSMSADAEQKKAELLGSNEMEGLMFKIEKDPRITSVGSFLRKTSLDELPQFYNILKGDMSLVGTRPPTEDEFEKYSLYYRRRLCMTPGLTGLWQVSGRSDISNFDEVVALDLQYIDKWCLSLDFKILLQTIGIVLFRRGAK